MTGDSYARSGGVREAIRRTAERTFAALSTDEQKAARQLFLRLVTPGEGQEDTRARAEIPSEPEQRRIIAQFTDARARLLVTGLDRAGRPTVEVAHEALIRTWPLLRSWIDANREELRSRAAIRQAQAAWEEQNRREDMLLSGFQLERARALIADPGDIPIEDLRSFIDLSSQREARREQAELDRERSAREAAERKRELARRNTRRAIFAVAALAIMLASAVVLSITTYRANNAANGATQYEMLSYSVIAPVALIRLPHHRLCN